MASKRSPVETARPDAPRNPRFFKTGYFVVLFAKSDRANISSTELVRIKKLSGDYNKASAARFEALLAAGELKEICHESKSQEGH